MSRALNDQPILIQVLSLNLLLLAFFVALTRISDGEKARIDAVSGSLNAAFRAEGRPARHSARFTAMLGNALADPAPMARIGDLVRTELAFATVRDIVPGEVMELTVEAARLFLDESAAIDPRYRRFLERIAAVLAAPAPGVRYDLEIAIGIQATAAADDPALRLAAERGAFVAAVLNRAGAPADTLASGLEPGVPGRVRMLFHVRPATEPRPPFARRDPQ